MDNMWWDDDIGEVDVTGFYLVTRYSIKVWHLKFGPNFFWYLIFSLKNSH